MDPGPVTPELDHPGLVSPEPDPPDVPLAGGVLSGPFETLDELLVAWLLLFGPAELGVGEVALGLAAVMPFGISSRVSLGVDDVAHGLVPVVVLATFLRLPAALTL